MHCGGCSDAPCRPSGAGRRLGVEGVRIGADRVGQENYGEGLARCEIDAGRWAEFDDPTIRRYVNLDACGAHGLAGVVLHDAAELVRRGVVEGGVVERVEVVRYDLIEWRGRPLLLATALGALSALVLATALGALTATALGALTAVLATALGALTATALGALTATAALSEPPPCSEPSPPPLSEPSPPPLSELSRPVSADAPSPVVSSWTPWCLHPTAISPRPMKPAASHRRRLLCSFRLCSSFAMVCSSQLVAPPVRGTSCAV